MSIFEIIFESLSILLNFESTKENESDKKYHKPYAFIFFSILVFFLCLFNIDQLTSVKNTDLLFWVISICSLILSFSLINFFRKKKIISELNLGQFLLYFIGTSLLMAIFLLFLNSQLQLIT
jgi:glucan phosphoethanolaminetransferase (alkaline phosphatase superfamily)